MRQISKIKRSTSN